jgi:mRNA interferase MazF
MSAVCITDSDFAEGGLRLVSYVRPVKLFTAHASLVTSVAGRLHDVAFRRVCDVLIDLLQQR